MLRKLISSVATQINEHLFDIYSVLLNIINLRSKCFKLFLNSVIIKMEDKYNNWLNIKDNLESIIITTMNGVKVYFKFKNEEYLYKVGTGEFNQWPTNIPSNKQLAAVRVKYLHGIMYVNLYDLKYGNGDCSKSIAEWELSHHENRISILAVKSVDLFKFL